MEKYRKLFIFPALLLVVLLLQNACNEDRLDLQPLSETENSLFERELDFERTVYGIYAKLSDVYWFNNNNPMHGMWHLPGDDITTTSANPFEIFGTLEPSNERLNDYYDAAYELISRANLFLQKIESAEEGVYSTPNLKEYHMGEALFLRGFMFYQLWNFFGTSPVITERIQTPDKITPPGSQGTELLDQAITDLQTAAGLLPASWDESNLGRVTANSANGMLGKALVFRATVTGSDEDYTAAINAFNMITDRALVENFGDNFSVNHENNVESLFEFQASQPAEEDNVWLPNDFNNAIGSMSAYWGWYENHWSLFGTAPFIPTQKLIDAFATDDPRMAYTLDPETQSFKKYLIEDQKSQSGVASVNNPRILRYADVLLLKAEALVQSGGSTAEAIGLMNVVRERARNSVPDTVAVPAAPAPYDVNTSDRNQIMQWIMDERFVELAGEEAHRWFDLRRWHMAGLINLDSFNFSSAVNEGVSFDPDTHLYFPIPTNEVDLNPNVTQNPGY